MLPLPRYAIYFVPAPASALARFGAGVLGYDVETGRESEPIALAGFEPARWHALTEEPRRYGFHATLKAPFRLAPGHDETALVAAFDTFADGARAVPVIAPTVRLLSRFVALVSVARSEALDALAAACVEEFDPFRAPPTADELAKRLGAPLSARERAHLERWGYPYVFDAFRFHMTLTGPLAPDERGPALAALTEAHARAGVAPEVAVARLALLRQDTPQARFRVLRARPIRARA